jgi:hypothetical protein
MRLNGPLKVRVQGFTAAAPRRFPGASYVEC